MDIMHLVPTFTTEDRLRKLVGIIWCPGIFVIIKRTIADNQLEFIIIGRERSQLIVHVISVLGESVKNAAHRRGVEEGDRRVQKAAQRVLVHLYPHHHISFHKLRDQFMSFDRPFEQ